MPTRKPSHMRGAAPCPIESTLSGDAIANGGDEWASDIFEPLGYSRITGAIRANQAVTVRVLQGLRAGMDGSSPSHWALCSTFTAETQYAPEGTGGSVYSVGWSPEAVCGYARIQVVNSSGSSATIQHYETNLRGIT